MLGGGTGLPEFANESDAPPAKEEDPTRRVTTEVNDGGGWKDVCKTQHGMDRQIAPEAFDPDSLEAVVVRTRPAAVAFNGKAAARIALRFRSRAPLPYGPLERPLAGAATWVVPSTSGAASGDWDPGPWSALAASLPAA